MTVQQLGETTLKYGMPDMELHAGEIKQLQTLLAQQGFKPGTVDGVFGLGTQAAVMAFQRSEGLLADGVVGARTVASLLGAGSPSAPLPSVTGKFTVEVVSQMFPHTAVRSIKKNLPDILSALDAVGIGDRLMVLAALATIRAETESFEPVAEGISRYNTSPNGPPFDLYDNRKDLGNQGKPDGKDFRGRGYVQLTGRANYKTFGPQLKPKQNLEKDPDLAGKSDIAAQLLALFLKSKERAIKEALLDRDYARARRCVNGGAHGLDRFTDAYVIGARLTA